MGVKRRLFTFTGENTSRSKIPRGYIRTAIILATLLVAIRAEEPTSYEDDDWVPITNTKEHKIEKKAAGRLLPFPETSKPSPKAFSIREKKSSNDQYLREVTSPINRQFQSHLNFDEQHMHQEIPESFEQHLNQGEILNQFAQQGHLPQREHLRQPPLLLQQNPPAFSGQTIFSNPSLQLSFRPPPLVKPSLPADVYLHTQKASSPFGFQAPILSNFSRSNYEKLNPGIQAINHGLAGDLIPARDTHFRSPSKPTISTDSIQLVYVPINSLNPKPLEQHHIQETPIQRQPLPAFSQPHQEMKTPQHHFSNQRLNPHKQQQLSSIQHDFAQQALNALNFQLQLQNGHVPSVVRPTITTTTTTTTTAAPPIQKRKPHQPPLAVYMGGNGDLSVSDVLSLLKNAKTISVQDSVGPNSPQVFVGPQNLEPPNGYVKFDLPYLSSLESNRIERKVDQLPFFVAPVSYKAPQGYSKILLPAPHVGSVVVSQKQKEQNSHIGLSQPTENSDSYNLYNKQSKTQFRFSNNIDNGAHRLDFRVQPSAPPSTPKISTPTPVLTQTINQYELEQINNHFLPQFHTPQQSFQPVQPDNEFSEYDDSSSSSQSHEKVANSQILSTSFPNDYKNYYRVRGHKENYVTTQPITSTRPVQFTDTTTRLAEAKPQLLAQQQVNHDYTEFLEPPLNFKPSEQTYLQSDVTSTPAPTVSFSSYLSNQNANNKPSYISSEPAPTVSFSSYLSNQNANNQPSYVSSEPAPTVSFSSYLSNQNANNKPFYVSSEPVPTIEVSKQSFQKPNYGPNLPEQNQYQYVNQEQQPQHVINSEKVNRPVIDPTYLQIDQNNQFVTQDNRHISHTLVQQEFEKNEQNAKDIKSVTHNNEKPQQVTEESYQNNFSKQEKEPHYVPLEGVTEYNEATENFKLPAQLPSIHPEIHSLINDLQDQSIRPLLVPPSIVPSNNVYSRPKYHQQLQVVSTVEPPVITTEPTSISYSSTTEAPTTTPFRRLRGRQRARVTTTTYAPRRAPSRSRKPVVRTTTENVNDQPEVHEEYNYFPTKTNRDYQRQKPQRDEYTQRPVSRVRSRTRGRTTQESSTTEQTLPSSTTSDYNFKQPQYISGFQASQVQPQSYMQLEHENFSNFQYQQHSTTEESPIITREPSTEHQQMNVDVIINHPITEKTNAEPVIISEPQGNSQYVRFSSNLDADVIVPKVEEHVPSTHVRIQGRGRVKSKSKTTQRPTTTTYRTTTEEEKQEEFYGFFRPPNFNAPQVPFNANFISTTKRPVYISDTHQHRDQYVDSNNENVYSHNVISSSTPYFVGELITSYNQEPTEVVTPEVPITKPTPRPRMRSRTRVINRKFKDDQVYVTPASESRPRSRGRSHFAAPHQTKDQNKSIDEDVEGGNYPKLFPRVEETTPVSRFQITIDPTLDEHNHYDDQIPFSSIRRQKIVPADSTETTDRSVINDLPVDRKVIESQEQTSYVQFLNLKGNDSNQENFENIMKEFVDEIDKIKYKDDIYEKKDTKIVNKPKARRRGAWRVIKRPVETFETAESQYVGKINANSLFANENKKEYYPVDSTFDQTTVKRFEENVTSQSVTQPSTTDFLDTFYKLFEVTRIDSSTTIGTTSPPETTTSYENTVTTETFLPKITTIGPVDTRNTTYATTSTGSETEDLQNTTNQSFDDQSSESTTASQTESWEAVRTSTATEISHETEICFRGKCVKTGDSDNPKV
ncbi:hypothetical protein FQA39_LY10755 [Lamprigera yunnana]|nr:hypothetical protein FQA39_LY10755 [Lamprigera yunnana]